MRYEHYDEHATQAHGSQWQSEVVEALAGIKDKKLREVIYAVIEATVTYADNEDENMDGHANELESRLDSLESDVAAAGYDDSEIYAYVERLETTVEELEMRVDKLVATLASLKGA